jgi:hypothetical protein
MRRRCRVAGAIPGSDQVLGERYVGQDPPELPPELALVGWEMLADNRQVGDVDGGSGEASLFGMARKWPSDAMARW